MPRLLIDQDLDHDILRGLIRRVGKLDAVTAFELGMSQATDEQLLVRAADQGRLTITHDRATMPTRAAKLIAEGEPMAGLIIVPRDIPLNQVLYDLELVVTVTDNEEWLNVILYLPL